jgi:VanZ family protein
MAVIFTASTDLLSSRQTSRFIEPILRWLRPGISEEAVRQVQWVGRKMGHLTEYAILALLLQRALRGPANHSQKGWSLSTARAALCLATLYAATDEFHQSLVASRTGSGWDVFIDAVGATVGLAAQWLRARLAGKKPKAT